MTVVINFFGGPSSGKSTLATYCFAMSKDDGFNSEYVPEKAKDWAWEKRKIKLIDQFELFSKQSKREKRLYHEASVILADSPVWLSAYYASLQDNRSAKKVMEELCKEFYFEADEIGIKHYFIWVKRVKAYNPKGRFQTEEQAMEIDKMMKPYLEKLGVTFLECNGVKEEAWHFVQNILSGYPEAKI